MTSDVQLRVWTGLGWDVTPVSVVIQCNNAAEAQRAAGKLSVSTDREVRWNWKGNDHGFYADAGIVKRQRIANFKVWEGVTWDATDTYTSARCYNDEAAHEKAARLSDLTGRVVRWNWEGSDKAHYAACDGHPAFALFWDSCTIPPVVLTKKEYSTAIYRDDDGCYEPRADEWEGVERKQVVADLVTGCKNYYADIQAQRRAGKNYADLDLIDTLLDDLSADLLEAEYQRGLADGQAKVG